MDSPQVEFSSAGWAGRAQRPLSRVRLRTLGISPDAASFRRRGFDAALPARRERLERIGAIFVAGYNCAVATADPSAAAGESARIVNESSGFFFEGAAMGFAVLDILRPRPRRLFQQFVAGAALPHLYMAYIGAGWALARSAVWLQRRLGELQPLLRPLLYDGLGFHCGFFHHRRAIEAQQVPAGVRRRWWSAFDQGLGRAVWFVQGADVEKVAATAAAFPLHRRGNLWSGIGLAAAYAGGVDELELLCLREAAGDYRWHASQGVAFAAKARDRAGNHSAHTNVACRLFCGCEAREAAELTDSALQELVRTTRDVTYEDWRAEMRASIIGVVRESRCQL